VAIRIRPVYAAPAWSDGLRILVDWIWPRGLSRENAGIAHWAKDVAPSAELRKWFAHGSSKWADFKRRYFAELDPANSAVELLIDRLRAGAVALSYAAREDRFNNAIALRDYLSRRLGRCKS